MFVCSELIEETGQFRKWLLAYMSILSPSQQVDVYN